MSDFKIWFKKMLPHEGGIADRPKSEDPGGYTNMGVTLNTWIPYAKKYNWDASKNGLANAKIWQIEIIAKDFWDAATFNSRIKNQGVAENLALALWGSGKGLIAEMQKAVNLNFGSKIPATGNVFQITTDAFNKINPVVLQDLLAIVHFKFLTRLPNWESNKYGWSNRLNVMQKSNDSSIVFNANKKTFSGSKIEPDTNKNRIILGVSIFGIIVFLLYLYFVNKS